VPMGKGYRNTAPALSSWNTNVQYTKLEKKIEALFSTFRRNIIYNLQFGLLLLVVSTKIWQ